MFDAEYYVDKHMALVEEGWKPAGMTGWHLIEYPETDGYPFMWVNVLSFQDRASFEAAQGLPVTKEIMGDVPNFTNTKPLFIPSKSVVKR